MSTFAELGRRQQVARLRRAASSALPRFGLDDAQLRLVAHDYNTTFRVDSVSGERFALRINLNSARPVEEIRGEVSWVEAVANDTDVIIARPRRTIDDDLVTTVDCDDIGRPVTVVVYEWLEGRNLGTSARPNQVRQIGRRQRCSTSTQKRGIFRLEQPGPSSIRC